MAPSARALTSHQSRLFPSTYTDSRGYIINSLPAQRSSANKNSGSFITRQCDGVANIKPSGIAEGIQSACPMRMLY